MAYSKVTINKGVTMKEYYYNVAVIADENGTRADFDFVYGPPLVVAGVVGDVFPEGATSVVVWATLPGLSEDMAAGVVKYWDDTYTSLGSKDAIETPAPVPVSKKVEPLVAKDKDEADEVYLDRVLTVAKELASVEVAKLEAATKLVSGPVLEVVK
jgi:hypothetical protein